MARYIVLLRSKGDGWMPDDILVDPERADLLVKRGFIQRLPDNLDAKIEKADEKGAKAAERAEAKAKREQEAEDERIRKEGEKALLENRPEAKKLAEFLEVELDEIFELSQDDYENGLEAMNASKGEDETPEA